MFAPRRWRRGPALAHVVGMVHGRRRCARAGQRGERLELARTPISCRPPNESAMPPPPSLGLVDFSWQQHSPPRPRRSALADFRAFVRLRLRAHSHALAIVVVSALQLVSNAPDQDQRTWYRPLQRMPNFRRGFLSYIFHIQGRKQSRPDHNRDHGRGRQSSPSPARVWISRRRRRHPSMAKIRVIGAPAPWRAPRAGSPGDQRGRRRWIGSSSPPQQHSAPPEIRHRPGPTRHDDRGDFRAAPSRITDHAKTLYPRALSVRRLEHRHHVRVDD